MRDKPRRGSRDVASDDDDDDFDCSEFVCEVMQTRLDGVEITQIDGKPLLPPDEYADDALKNAEAALRKATREFERFEVSSGCPGRCYCRVKDKQKLKKGGWKQAGQADVEAQFTFPGAKFPHTARGVADKYIRFLKGRCRRNEIMKPA